jgi:hypothetical protein
MSETLGELAVIGVLVFLNAIFVAAEIALVTVRRSRVDQLIDDGSRGARRVHRLIADPGRFLAVIQIGINFLGFLASAFAAVSLTAGLPTRPDRVLGMAPVPSPDPRRSSSLSRSCSGELVPVACPGPSRALRSPWRAGRPPRTAAPVRSSRS